MQNEQAGSKHPFRRKAGRRAGGRLVRYRRTHDVVSISGLSLDGMNTKALAWSPPEKARFSSSRQAYSARPALPRQSKSAVLARSAIISKSARRPSARRPRFRLVKISVTLFVFLLGGGSFMGFTRWYGRANPDNEPIVLAKNTDEAAHSTELSENTVPPEVIDGYEVDADLPRVITISKIQVSARIKRIVAQSSGELSAPRNIYDAGWYDGSVKPGEKGTALLVGHVFGASQPGIFYRLNNLTQNDIIEIEMGDGRKLTFKVVSIEYVSHENVDLEKALASSDPSRPTLNLLTYSGRYDVRTNSYEKRIFIHAISQ